MECLSVNRNLSTRVAEDRGQRTVGRCASMECLSVNRNLSTQMAEGRGQWAGLALMDCLPVNRNQSTRVADDGGHRADGSGQMTVGRLTHQWNACLSTVNLSTRLAEDRWQMTVGRFSINGMLVCQPLNLSTPHLSTCQPINCSLSLLHHHFFRYQVRFGTIEYLKHIHALSQAL
jgi:hypothetical protein